MSNQPNWKKCKDCCKATLLYPSNEVDRISRENQLSCGSQMRELQGTINLSTLCDKCIIITPCSVCKKIISTPECGIRAQSALKLEDSGGWQCTVSVHCSTPHIYTGSALSANILINTPVIRIEISNFNEEPICTECKNIQCYRCGEEGDIKTWYNWIICEECSMALCNNCNGECDNPCEKCERPCDNCNCSEDDEEE